MPTLLLILSVADLLLAYAMMYDFPPLSPYINKVRITDLTSNAPMDMLVYYLPYISVAAIVLAWILLAAKLRGLSFFIAIAPLVIFGAAYYLASGGLAVPPNY